MEPNRKKLQRKSNPIRIRGQPPYLKCVVSPCSFGTPLPLVMCPNYTSIMHSEGLTAKQLKHPAAMQNHVPHPQRMLNLPMVHTWYIWFSVVRRNTVPVTDARTSRVGLMTRNWSADNLAEAGRICDVTVTMTHFPSPLRNDLATLHHTLIF